MGLAGRLQGLYLQCSFLGATNPIMPFTPLCLVPPSLKKPMKPPKLPLPCRDSLFIFQAALPQQLWP